MDKSFSPRKKQKLALLQAMLAEEVDAVGGGVGPPHVGEVDHSEGHHAAIRERTLVIGLAIRSHKLLCDRVGAAVAPERRKRSEKIEI